MLTLMSKRISVWCLLDRTAAVDGKDDEDECPSGFADAFNENANVRNVCADVGSGKVSVDGGHRTKG